MPINKHYPPREAIPLVGPRRNGPVRLRVFDGLPRHLSCNSVRHRSWSRHPPGSRLCQARTRHQRVRCLPRAFQPPHRLLRRPAQPHRHLRALAELRYALDELHADGVTLFTRYGRGNQYLGDPAFAPIWAELDARAAVVFVHPTSGASVQLVNPTLPLPMIDYPQETTRAAADLIVSGVKRAHPRCKIILSHAGGTLPYLVGRLAMYSAAYPERGSHAQIVEDAKSFYFDTALSTDKHVLDLLISWAGPDRILFGSDFPYAPTESIKHFGKQLDGYGMSEDDRQKIYRDNALSLFPRLRNTS
ncbi:hypothetical protein C8T65DRAFT_168845 [Cerioporus squamosus]|nr:hypothetical protein C8T65DRAFT_168845 [Cerioporus squamosus]